MKFKLTWLTAVFIFFSLNILAQDFDLKWSDQSEYNNKDGFFKEFIGINATSVYARFGKGIWKRSKNDFKLVAYDKETMKEVAKKVIIGFGSKDNDKYKGLSYHKSIVYDDVIYLFWTKRVSSKTELYVETFNDKLKQVGKIKKIYTHEAEDKRSASNYNGFFVLGNIKAGTDLVIGSERGGKSENVRFQYFVLNSELDVSTEQTITLPFQNAGGRYGVSNAFFYGSDGNLYVRSLCRIPKSERKKGEQDSYSILSIVNLKSGESESFTMKFDHKNIFDFGYTVSPDGKVKVYGFFCDLDKDPYGGSNHGIFYSVLDSDQLAESKVNFTYFDKPTLDKLFEADQYDKARSSTFMRSKKKKKEIREADSERLRSDYTIEVVDAPDPNHIVLFCSIMYNYTVQNCTTNPQTGTQTCRTEYYCNKRNVTVFKLNNDGEIVWATNHNRSITYSGWDIYDVQVAHNKNSYYVLYGSVNNSTQANTRGIFRSKEKKAESQFEYAVFDGENGDLQKQTFKVDNSGATKAIDKKYVNPLNTFVYDNVFYVNSTVYQRKVGGTIAVCLGSLVCPPVFFMLNSPATIRAKGNIGKLAPAE